MKIITRSIHATLGLFLAVIAPLAHANVVNGGFETGDTSNWVLTIPTGGTAIVATEHAGESSTYLPNEGTYFLELKTDGPGSYTTAEQAITMGAGETIIGSAAFDCKDYSPYNDNAFVEILDATQAVIATPWTESCGSLGDYVDGPWTEWSFTATSSGNYTLLYRVSNFQDGGLASYALYDGPETRIPSVPVPVFSSGIAWLLSAMVGLIAAGAIRRRTKTASM